MRIHAADKSFFEQYPPSMYRNCSAIYCLLLISHLCNRVIKAQRENRIKERRARPKPPLPIVRNPSENKGIRMVDTVILRPHPAILANRIAANPV